MQMLEDINARGTTVVMVTHDPELARRAHRNVHVMDGQVTDYTELVQAGNRERAVANG
jgi:putative ABC transport system ATP-binding protein